MKSFTFPEKTLSWNKLEGDGTNKWNQLEKNGTTPCFAPGPKTKFKEFSVEISKKLNSPEPANSSQES